MFLQFFSTPIFHEAAGGTLPRHSSFITHRPSLSVSPFIIHHSSPIAFRFIIHSSSFITLACAFLSSRYEWCQIFPANCLLAESLEKAVDLGQIETRRCRDLDANGPAVLRVVHQESPVGPLSPSALLAVAARQVIVGSQWAALAIRDALNGFQAAAWK